MMRRSLFVLFAAVFTASIALPEQAEGQYRPWEISIGGGPSFPTGDFSDIAGTGYHVQGSVGFDLPLLPFGLRADVLWQELDAQDDWFRQVGGLANATFGLPLIFIQPYALVGAGVIRTSAPDVGPGSASSTDVGFNAGVGLDFPFVGLGGFIEARYLNVFGSDNATNFRVIPVTVGIRF